MNEQHILEVERDNHDRIYIYVRGNFWRSYERSAFHLVKVIETRYTPLRNNEDIKERVICFSFHDSTMNEMTRGFTVLEQSNDRVVLKAKESFTEDEFLEWKSVLLSMMGKR